MTGLDKMHERRWQQGNESPLKMPCYVLDLPHKELSQMKRCPLSHHSSVLQETYGIQLCDRQLLTQLFQELPASLSGLASKA